MAVDMNKLLDGNGLLFALQGFMAKVTTLLGNKVDKVSGKGLSTNDYTTAEKEKLSGIAAGANNYTHPTHTAYKSGLYKLVVDSLGHVTDASAVTKADITALGIPGQDTNTTYSPATQSANGLMTAADKSKLDGISAGANAYTLPTAGAALGGVKTTSTVTNASGYTPAPIIDGVPYYKDTNTTYSDVTQNAHGLMTAADKKKLDAFGAASSYATTTYVGQQIAAAGHISKQIVTTLPAASAAKENVIYMVQKTSGSGSNLYDEYMLINGKLELVGDSATKIDTLTNADITEILGQI